MLVSWVNIHRGDISAGFEESGEPIAGPSALVLP